MNIIKKLGAVVCLGLIFSGACYGTGPRVSPSLVSSALDIYTVKLPPFIDSDIQQSAYLSEVINTVLQQEKIDAVLTVLPLQNMVSYYLLNDNAFAALNPYVNLTAEQQKDLLIVPLETVNESYIYYQPAHPEGLAWQGDLNKLKGLRYGAVKGEPVKKYREAGIEVKTMRLEMLVKKLAAQEIDFIRLPDATADWLINQQFAEQEQQFKRMAQSAGTLQIAVIFNKKHAEGVAAAEKFKRGLNALIKNGRFQQIKEQSLKHDTP